jgi:hypothetical protein
MFAGNFGELAAKIFLGTNSEPTVRDQDVPLSDTRKVVCLKWDRLESKGCGARISLGEQMLSAPSC